MKHKGKIKMTWHTLNDEIVIIHSKEIYIVYKEKEMELKSIMPQKQKESVIYNSQYIDK